MVKRGLPVAVDRGTAVDEVVAANEDPVNRLQSSLDTSFLRDILAETLGDGGSIESAGGLCD